MSLIVTCTIIFVGVLFVILGILNGGNEDVIAKAVKICTECIGLG
ncbi:MAG: thioredoxin [Clostridia bacterium]|nr:thioredoxin [Clostridia bacterium]